jgi:hypothetical protein
MSIIWFLIAICPTAKPFGGQGTRQPIMLVCEYVLPMARFIIVDFNLCLQPFSSLPDRILLQI